MQDEKEPGAGWVFKPGSNEPSSQDSVNSPEFPQEGIDSNPDTAESAHQDAFVSWSASEYIANPKNMAWFGSLGIGTLVLSAGVYFITKDYISTGVIAVLGIIVGVFAARQPMTLEYHVDAKGIHIGPKFYPYNVFRAFSVASDGAFSYVSLSPLKRFMPPIAIHYDPKDGDKIVDALGNYLPYEEHKQDIVDSISRRVRF